MPEEETVPEAMYRCDGAALFDPNVHGAPSPAVEQHRTHGNSAAGVHRPEDLYQVTLHLDRDARHPVRGWFCRNCVRANGAVIEKDTPNLAH